MSTFKEDVMEYVGAIYETIADSARGAFALIKEIWPFLLLLLTALLVLLWIAKPAPPNKVYMATGLGSSYVKLGEQYREYFKQRGIDLILVPTGGSYDNLRHLIDRTDPIQIALVQGGTMGDTEVKGVQSLGTIDYEPMWVFYRNHVLDEQRHLIDKDIAKLKLGVGSVGSGTHLQAMNLLKLNNLPTTGSNLFALSNFEGVQALERGELDALLLVDGFKSEAVQRLIHNPQIQLANFKRADAYDRLLPYFEKVTIPMGGLNLARNTPDHPIQLISTTTNLLIDDRLHPAIQLLLLQAAQEINGKESYFAKAGQFPAYLNSELPLSEEARYFYQNGSPASMKYLPFWMAEFLERMFLLLIPFAAFAYPIVKSIPNYRINLARKKLNAFYKELIELEQSFLQENQLNRRSEYLQILDELERRVLATKGLSLIVADCYALRNNIDFIRAAIEKQSPFQGA
jgi:TRAP-type uncharacterized transport system substrate-binding protein